LLQRTNFLFAGKMQLAATPRNPPEETLNL
jgi:hypothetical protein